MHPQQFEEFKNVLKDLKQATTTHPGISSAEPILAEEMPLRSQDQKDLFAALAKAQAEMPLATKSSFNPYYKSAFASFADIISASRNVLSKHGLAVSQDIIERENGQKYLYTVLSHASGQFKASRIKLQPPKTDIQFFGSYLSTIKRHTYAALTGVADSMEDDDSETVMEEVRDEKEKKTPQKKKQQFVPLPSEETITREQLEQLNIELEEYEEKDYEEIVDRILSGFHIQTLADIPKQQYSFVLKRIRELQMARMKGEGHGISNAGATK